MPRLLATLCWFYCVLHFLAVSSTLHAQTWSGDTLSLNPITFLDESPEGWNAPYKKRVNFPEQGSWSKILLIQTLRCDSATAGDAYPCGEWDYIWNTLIEIPRGDSLEVFSLGSFVTPYGKRLKLGGEQGWEWIYDITEYAPLLQGERNLTCGNNQELLDLKIRFIKGVPERQVLAVENVYPYATYSYESLATDSLLKEKKFVLSSDAAGFRLKAVISGHGHAGPRNCCEWDSKTHSYYLNGYETYRWNVWKDCGNNPIYPQGGTWPFDRAGWCPGTKVDEYEFELTSKVTPGDTISLDYGIENFYETGEKEGEFRMSHQLFTYGPPSFKYDASLVDIIQPSDQDTYSRINPSCTSPRIVIKNSGRLPLKTMDIIYGLKGQRKAKYKWTGHLDFLEQAEVDLPAIAWKKLRSNGIFEVELRLAKTLVDDNMNNNKLSSVYTAPMQLPAEFILAIHTNNLGRASENSFTITDNDGLAWYDVEEMEDSTLYRYPIALSKGCYSFQFRDSQEEGISVHWWNRNAAPERVGINGSIQLESLTGDTLKTWPADFGEQITFNFIVN